MATYCKLNAEIERVSEMYYFFAMKLSLPVAILPATILTIVNYFAFNMGDESYFLPYQIVYVWSSEERTTKKIRVECISFSFIEDYRLIGKHRLDLRLH